MAYANNRLYDEVIRKMLARLASDVKARELMLHLSCLTLTDREEIEAKRETVGNYNAIVLLIDNLRKRENWPDQLINALRNCEHQTLAADIQDAYDRIRGTNTSAAVVSVPAAPAAVIPASSPAPITTDDTATVIMATVHIVPHVIPSLLTQREAPNESPIVAEPPLSSSEYNKISTASQLPAVSEESKVEAIGHSSLLKHPVQNTNSTGNQDTLCRDSQNTSTINQHLEGTQTEVPANCQTQPPSPPRVTKEVKEDFGKPGTLREEESVSVSSDDLEISHATTETECLTPLEQTMSDPVSNTQVSKEPFEKLSIYTTEHVSVSDHIPCENAAEISTPEVSSNLSNDFPDGETSFPNQPVEDHYVSISKSLQTDTVRFSELSSMQNLNGQPQSVIGNAAQANKESAELNHHSECHIQSVDPEVQLTQHNQGIINSNPSQRRKESQAVLSQFQSDPRFIAAAVFGVTAVLVAWKFK